ncbi:MAG: D-TA family PLP-dependent enzyme [Tannerellaceae bacterium]|nr:D-TA family PLP-dependent enzyme [Tannerellaceae bacterium]
MKDYIISDIARIDSPALAVYEDKVRNNILLAIQMTGDADRLRPHIKTHKMEAVCRMMIDLGISKFKCATIAEAEILAKENAPDVLLAYQPVGPKIERLLKLVETYPHTRFSCLVDCPENVVAMDTAAGRSSLPLHVFVDVNVGMNRTGASPQQAVELAKHILPLKHIRVAGLHGYDGHIHDTGLAERQKAADASFAELDKAYQALSPLFSYPLARVVGGTPTFPIHACRSEVECSPGTFVFWDWGYRETFPDMPFQYAALVICRVISVIDERRICLDLGHKSIASETPLPRVHFPNAGITPIAHSEEHLVVETPDSRLYPVGSVCYGVPVHICPTVALYEKAFVIKDHQVATTWPIRARDRFITI